MLREERVCGLSLRCFTNFSDCWRTTIIVIVTIIIYIVIVIIIIIIYIIIVIIIIYIIIVIIIIIIIDCWRASLLCSSPTAALVLFLLQRLTLSQVFNSTSSTNPSS